MSSIQEKLHKIVAAIQSGISVYKIDPVGKGYSARLVLQGRMPTQRKLDQMFTNVLLLEKQNPSSSSPSLPSYSFLKTETPALSNPGGESEHLINQRLRLDKIQAIIAAANSGISPTVIDPVGNGGAIRRLLNGSTATPKKVDQMYDNVLRYQQKQILQNKPLVLRLKPENNPDNKQKISFLLEAVDSGISKTEIDPTGKAIRRLEKGLAVKQKTLDLMYCKILHILGYSDSQPDSLPASIYKNYFAAYSQQISSLQNLVVSLFEKVNILEASIHVLQNHVQPSKKKSIKILGATLMQKASRVKGRRYRCWHGLYLDVNNKRRWIYIGADLSEAKNKILAWFERYPQDVHPIHLS